MAVTYEYLKTITRPWGYEVLLKFLNNGNNLYTENFLFREQPTQQQVINRADAVKARIEARIEWELNRCTLFDDYGAEVKEPIYWLIAKIRQYPAATLAQAETQWNATWADSFIDFDKLVAKIQALVGNVTWDQFKTYVINHNFAGLD